MHLDRTQRRVLAGACVALGAIGAALSLAIDTAAGPVLLVLTGLLCAVGWLDAARRAGAPDDETQDLVARMSHELRTPLTSVVGLLEVLSGESTELEHEEQAELLGLARSEASLMEHLVANLHTASRLARDVLDHVAEPVHLANLVTRVVDRFPTVARRTYLPSSDLHAFADPHLADQIVTNLVQNVERYAPEGELSIAIERRRDRVAVIFSDDGPGVDGPNAAALFDRSSSDRGLGIGLGISRELAEAMGGRLDLETARRKGASFALLLPYTDLHEPAGQDHPDRSVMPVVAHSPRARLLVDLAAAFAERSLDRTMAGIHRLYVELLRATGTVLMLPEDEVFRPIAGSGTTGGPWIADSTLRHVLRTGTALELTGISEPGVPDWQADLNGRAALALPVIDAGRVVGVLVVAFNHSNDIPAGRPAQLAVALAQLAAFAIHRSALARDVAFERTLRSSVMESLPIAISVFAGDPPEVVDWNQRERDMLGLGDEIQRPSDLRASQAMFDVRFADGTPLTVDNAPVTAAIRTGRSTGPFLLMVRRGDGTDITTRTYCAPFFNDDGTVAGAVVTSEELDVAKPTLESPDERWAGAAGN